MRELTLVSGFSRGGTNVVWNLICSHPRILTTGVELNQIMGKFTGLPLKDKLLVELFAVPHLPAPLGKARFLAHRIIATAEAHARGAWGRWKSPDTAYSESEITALPICTKSVSSWSPGPLYSFLQRNCPLKYNPLLFQAFGSVKTIYVIRDGEALCNGWMRRGCTARNAGYWYARIARKMIEDHQARPRDVAFVRFTDVLGAPLAMARNLHKFFGLVELDLASYHLKSKKVLQSTGVHETPRGRAEEMFWLDGAEVPRFLNPQVDEVQRDRLSDVQRNEFLHSAGDVERRLKAVPFL